MLYLLVFPFHGLGIFFHPFTLNKLMGLIFLIHSASLCLLIGESRTFALGLLKEDDLALPFFHKYSSVLALSFLLAFTKILVYLQILCLW